MKLAVLASMNDHVNVRPPREAYSAYLCKPHLAIDNFILLTHLYLNVVRQTLDFVSPFLIYIFPLLVYIWLCN